MSSRPSRGAARLAAILDALPDGLVLVNANGTVVNANSIALEMFEVPGTALVGRGLLDLLPEFDSKLIPGSMRRPASTDARGRTKPTRMVARRTDGVEFPAEVTSASLEDGRDAYNEANSSYTGDELLMLVVRDLTGTVDTEAELARSQRQTEMILRAASEGVVGTDTDGRVVLVNPAAAQILGFRATDLGGRELHTLVLHSRANGDPFPYDESPLADTLRSGRKHRVRGQVLWAKNGSAVPVDLTTAPVRDGDQLVGAVMTFTDRRGHEDLVHGHAEELKEAKESAAAELASVRDELTGRLTETEKRLTGERTEVEDRLTALLREAEETHTAELADRSDRYAAEIEELAERYDFVSARHAQLTAVLGEALRGPLVELHGELSTLATDPAGQLWPEANQILHHLAAGYARMTTLVDNVLGYQRLDAGSERLNKVMVLLDAVVAAGVEGAVELIGPGRAQFAVHAPPIEAEVDPGRLATALAHLIADVAGVDATGRTRQMQPGGYVDSTIVVAAAQRGDVVRIEVRGPFPGGDPVHEPIVTGIVRAHGGVLQTHEVPGMSGRAFVLELPLGEGGGTVPPQPPQPRQELVGPGDVGGPGTTRGGRRRARRSSTDAFLAAPDEGGAEPTGRRRARPGGPEGAAPEQETEAPGLQLAAGTAGPAGQQGDRTGAGPGTDPGMGGAQAGGGTGRRRGRPSPGEAAQPGAFALPPGTPQGTPSDMPQGSAVLTAAENARPSGLPTRGSAVPPGGVPMGPAPAGAGQTALPALPSGPIAPQPAPASASRPMHEPDALPAPAQGAPQQQPSGRRARRALAPAQEHAATAAPGTAEGARSAFALPPAAADRGRHDAARAAVDADHTPPQPHPLPNGAGSGMPGAPGSPVQANGWPAAPGQQIPGRSVPGQQTPGQQVAGQQTTGPQVPGQGGPGQNMPGQDPSALPSGHGRAPGLPGPGVLDVMTGQPESQGQAGRPPVPQQPRRPAQPLPAAQPLPDETPAAGTAMGSAPAGAAADSSKAFSVRTLGQGVPFTQQGQQGQPPHPGQQGQPGQPGQPQDGTGAGPLGSGRRRKLGTRAESGGSAGASAVPHPQNAQTTPHTQARPGSPGQGTAAPMPPGAAAPQAGAPQVGGGAGQSSSRLATGRPEGRSYAIGAPDEGAEGPQPLDGPGGAVEVTNRPQPRPVDDELPPEPLDNPRRLLVWPAPDVSTQHALSERGYRPVVVHSREEVDAQIAAFPAALFVDPLTGPITRTALQSLRQAAVAAEVPVLVTAGLGQANREAAYGADPAVLLKALAPRDSDQHPPRVLLVEEHEEIASALTATLERRGMQVARAAEDNEAVALAGQMRPNLVVMDLMQVRRRRAGIIDWLRANGQLNRTPLVVYTSVGIDRAELPRLASGETVLFLAERSTSAEVQERIVDLLAKIGTN